MNVSTERINNRLMSVKRDTLVNVFCAQFPAVLYAGRLD